MTRQHHGADRVVRAAAPHVSGDMNVTPLIDVLLVLLIIFMAALPLSQRGAEVALPEEARAQPEAFQAAQVVAEYTADHRLTINKQPVSLAEAAARFEEIYKDRRDKTLYVIGDGTVRYGEIMAVIDAALGSGVDKVGIVTEGMRREALERRGG